MNKRQIKKNNAKTFSQKSQQPMQVISAAGKLRIQFKKGKSNG